MGEGVGSFEAPSSSGLKTFLPVIISLGVVLKSVNNVLNKYNLEKMTLALIDDFDGLKNV